MAARARRRGMAVVLACAVAAAITGSAVASPRDYEQVFNENRRGDITGTGNTLMSCFDADPRCAAARAGTASGGDLNTSNLPMDWVDVDGDRPRPHGGDDRCPGSGLAVHRRRSDSPALDSRQRPEGRGGVVVSMPQRSDGSGVWEPWSDERALARHYAFVVYVNKLLGPPISDATVASGSA